MSLRELVAWLSLAVAAIALILNSRKDTRTDAAREARTEAKLDNIINGVSEVRLDQRAMSQRVDVHDTRLTKVEEREVDDRRRIDDLETKFNQAHPPA